MAFVFAQLFGELLVYSAFPPSDLISDIQLLALYTISQLKENCTVLLSLLHHKL
jgi:hypothetical protein